MVINSKAREREDLRGQEMGVGKIIQRQKKGAFRQGIKYQVLNYYR